MTNQKDGERSQEQLKKYGESKDKSERKCPECEEEYDVRISEHRYTKGLGVDLEKLRNKCVHNGVFYFHYES